MLVKGSPDYLTEVHLGCVFRVAFIGIAPFMHLRADEGNMNTFKGNNMNQYFLYHKGLIFKERICYLWEQIFSLKKSPHFERQIFF